MFNVLSGLLDEGLGWLAAQRCVTRNKCPVPTFCARSLPESPALVLLYGGRCNSEGARDRGPADEEGGVTRENPPTLSEVRIAALCGPPRSLRHCKLAHSTTQNTTPAVAQAAVHRLSATAIVRRSAGLGTNQSS